MTPEKRDIWMASRTFHGGYLGGKERPMHYVWRSMVSRCDNPADRSFAYYGGRGISVSQRWLSYENFVEDMGERPSPQHSIDRIDVNGNYEISNCRWATRSEQQRNKTSTRLYRRESDAFTGTLIDCSKTLGISESLAWWRFKNWGTFLRGESWHELQKP